MLYVINISIKLVVGVRIPDLEVNGCKSACKTYRMVSDLSCIPNMWHIFRHINNPLCYIINKKISASCFKFLGGKKLGNFLLWNNLSSKNYTTKLDKLSDYYVPAMFIQDGTSLLTSIPSLSSSQ